MSLAFACVALSVAPNIACAAPPLVQQCVTANGNTLYTDKPCRSIGARPVAMRGELATRLVRESATEARYAGIEVAYVTGTGTAPKANTATMRAAREAIGRRSVHGGCARTTTQLAMDLRGAFALGDVNRIAESFHWVGMSQRAANATMTRLQSLTKRNLVDVQFYDAQIGGWMETADAGGGSGGSNGGVMQLQFGNGTAATIQDFDVVRNNGCWFVRF